MAKIVKASRAQGGSGSAGGKCADHAGGGCRRVAFTDKRNLGDFILVIWRGPVPAFIRLRQDPDPRQSQTPGYVSFAFPRAGGGVPVHLASPGKIAGSGSSGSIKSVAGTSMTRSSRKKARPCPVSSATFAASRILGRWFLRAGGQRALARRSAAWACPPRTTRSLCMGWTANSHIRPTGEPPPAPPTPSTFHALALGTDSLRSDVCRHVATAQNIRAWVRPSRIITVTCCGWLAAVPSLGNCAS